MDNIELFLVGSEIGWALDRAIYMENFRVGGTIGSESGNVAKLRLVHKHGSTTALAFFAKRGENGPSAGWPMRLWSWVETSHGRTLIWYILLENSRRSFELIKVSSLLFLLCASEEKVAVIGLL